MFLRKQYILLHFQIIYEACYSTTDLDLLMYSQSRDDINVSFKKESTSSSNHRVDGTGKGNDQQEGVPVESLSVPAVPAKEGALTLSLTSCCSLCQSREDIRVPNESAELEPTSSFPTLVGPTSTAVTEGLVADSDSTRGSDAKGSATMTLSIAGLDSILREQLVSPDPDSLKLMLKLDMTTDNLENEIKQFSKDTQPTSTATLNTSTTSCYKGMVYHLITLKPN